MIENLQDYFKSNYEVYLENIMYTRIEDEFIDLVKKSGLTRQIFEELTDHPMGNMFLSATLTAYMRAKNIFDVIEGDMLSDK